MESSRGLWMGSNGDPRRQFYDLQDEEASNRRSCWPKICVIYCDTDEEFVKYLAAELGKMCYNVIIDGSNSCLDKEKAVLRLEEILSSCCLGVIVLSDEFFRTEARMTELALLVECQKLISLFFQLSIDEFNDQNRRATWRNVWKHWQKEETYEQATTLLWSKSGRLDYSTLADATLVEYVQIIAGTICPDLIPIQVHWSKESSRIEAKERICGEVDKWFLNSPLLRKRARVLGIHGGWGAGKTTLAKCLCEFYSSEFRGRVYHLELFDSKSQLQMTKDVLTKLFGANPVFLKRHVRDLGQAHAYLDHCLEQTSQKVFLVIDHIQDSWESQEKAKDLYLRRVSFPTGSMILFLARTSDTLEQLLLPSEDNSCSIKGIPQLNFLDSNKIFRGMLLSGLSGDKATKWEKVSERIRISDILSVCVDQHPNNQRVIHPLRFMSLGSYFRDKGIEYWLSALTQQSSQDVFKDIKELKRWKEDGILGMVFKALRDIYDTLDVQVQQVFLDIALYIPKRELPWLCRLHDRPDEFYSTSSKCLQKLRAVTFVTVEDKMIKMHSSCRVFAEKLARHSKNLVYVVGETVKQVDIRNMLQTRLDAIERVAFEACVFDNGDSWQPFILDLSDCKCMRVLRLLNITCGQEVQVQLGRNKLLSLEISSISSPIIFTGDMFAVKCFSGSVKMIAGSPPLNFESLEVLDVYTPRKIGADGLDRGAVECHASKDLKESFEEYDLKHFQSCGELEVLWLAFSSCSNQTGELELYPWLRLKELILYNVCGLRILCGLKGLNNLRTLHVQRVDDLVSLSGLESSSKLEVLHLISCKAVSELRLPGGKGLAHCCIRMCESLTRIDVVDQAAGSSSDYGEEGDEIRFVYDTDWWLNYPCRDNKAYGATTCSDPGFNEDLVHVSTGSKFDIQECSNLRAINGLSKLSSIEVSNFGSPEKESSLQVVSPGALDFERFSGVLDEPAKPFFITHFNFVNGTNIADLCILEVEGVQVKGFVQELMEGLQDATSLRCLVVRCRYSEERSCGCDDVEHMPCFSLLPKSLLELTFRCSRVVDLTSIGDCRQLTKIDLSGCCNVNAWPDRSRLSRGVKLSGMNDWYQVRAKSYFWRHQVRIEALSRRLGRRSRSEHVGTSLSEGEGLSSFREDEMFGGQDIPEFKDNDFFRFENEEMSESEDED